MRFANGRRRLLDSLRDNAYGVFVLHYPIVSWLQYALLPVPLPGIVKGALVFVGSLAASWGAMTLLRRLWTLPAGHPKAVIKGTRLLCKQRHN